MSDERSNDEKVNDEPEENETRNKIEELVANQQNIRAADVVNDEDMLKIISMVVNSLDIVKIYNMKMEYAIIYDKNNLLEYIINISTNYQIEKSYIITIDCSETSVLDISLSETHLPIKTLFNKQITYADGDLDEEKHKGFTLLMNAILNSKSLKG